MREPQPIEGTGADEDELVVAPLEDRVVDDRPLVLEGEEKADPGTENGEIARSR